MPVTAIVSHMLSDVWFDRIKVEEEEYQYQVYLQNQRVKPAKKTVTVVDPKSSVAQQIAEARQKIHQTLQNSDASTQGSGAISSEVLDELKRMRCEHSELKKIVDKLSKTVMALELRLTKLSPNEKDKPGTAPAVQKKEENSSDDDDDIDLFGSDSEDDGEKERIKQERLAAYADKKAKKPTVIAKSTIILDVKPWDDETDMKELEEKVRSVQTDGLLWGSSKLVDVAYGIKKLQITCVVVDDKVGTDFLEEEICGFEELVQSIDIVAFQKI